MPYISYEQVEADSSIKTSDDLTIPTTATFAMIQADTANARFTLDGTIHPSFGKRLIVGFEPERVLIQDLRNIRFIRESGTNSNINIHYGTE